MNHATLASSRREFLRRAGLATAGATVLVAGAARRPARADTTLAPFVHGVASGDPLSDRVILWTRVTPPEGHDGSPIPVRWSVATDPDLTAVVASGTVAAVAETDWTVKVDPSGLAPDTFHFYGFEALGRASLTARTRTMPAPGQPVEGIRLAVVACANYQQGWFNAYARISERDDVAAVICTGDYLYEYEDGGYGPGSAIGRGHVPPHEMVTLADYRQRHAQYKLDPDLRRSHQLVPWVTTWDDHESTNNSWRDGASNHTDGDEGDWASRKAACQQAYDEWMPIRSTGDRAVIYRGLGWGDLVDVIVLDTRLEGRDQQVEFAGQQQGSLLLVPEASDPDRHIISPTQMDFLLTRLSTSKARWKLVAQQVIVSQWNAGAIPLMPEGAPDFPMLIRDGGNALNADAWDGYQADQLRLIRHLRDEAIDDVVILTGDVHSSWAFDVTEDPSSPVTYNPITGEGSRAVEFVAPAVASESLGDTFNSLTRTPIGADAFEVAMRANNPQLKHLDAKRQGFIILDVTTERCQADWFHVTVDEPNDDAVHGASWFTASGENRLQEAQGPVEAGIQGPKPPTEPPGPAPAPSPGSPNSATLPVTGGGAAAAALAIAAAASLRRRSPDG